MALFSSTQNIAFEDIGFQVILASSFLVFYVAVYIFLILSCLLPCQEIFMLAIQPSSHEFYFE